MEAIYNKTGRFTNDGIKFHIAHTNVRIGRKHYWNATEETLLGLGFFREYFTYVLESEYERAFDEYGDDKSEGFLYKGHWDTLNGEKIWLVYYVIPDEYGNTGE